MTLKNLPKLVDDVVCQLSHWKNRKDFKQMRSESGVYSLKGFDRLKCIYIHIPKAAGISINKALFDNYGGGHKTVRVYKRIFGPAVYKEYFTFTFVRNPYSRLLSAYRFLKNGGFSETDRTWAIQNLSEYSSFDDFIKLWIDEESIWSLNHFKPQYSFVCDVSLTPEVDFIGKVESIEEDFEKVCSILNIPNKLEIRNKGKTDNTNWEHFYSDYSIDKITDIYSRDFELFQYEKL